QPTDYGVPRSVLSRYAASTAGSTDNSATRQNRRNASELAADFALSGGLAPAVSERGVVGDVDEGGVAIPELVSDTLDCRADVRSISIFPTPSDETFVVQTIVDGAIGDVATGVRGEQMDDVVFAQRQPHVDLV